MMGKKKQCTQSRLILSIGLKSLKRIYLLNCVLHAPPPFASCAVDSSETSEEEQKMRKKKKEKERNSGMDL